MVVNVLPWNGGAKDISPTLELLNDIMEDEKSPARGKVFDVPERIEEHLLNPTDRRIGLSQSTHAQFYVDVVAYCVPRRRCIDHLVLCLSHRMTLADASLGLVSPPPNVVS